jgi:hypothetical protein
MSTPPIRYSGPVISPDVPWETRRHLQLLYQKLGNHTQAFQQVSNQISGLKKGSTTTTVVEGGGGSSPVTPSSSFIGQGLINDQTGATAYATQPSDNGILLIFNDASPVAVTLTTDSAPFYLIIANFGAGTATLTPSTGTINGGASLSLLQNQTLYVSCDSTNWDTDAIRDAADVNVANTWNATQTFKPTINFVDIAGDTATVGWASGTFAITATPIAGNTAALIVSGPPTAVGVGTTVFAAAAEVSNTVEAIVSGTPYRGCGWVETTLAKFLNASNTIEYQFGAIKGVGILSPSVAIGDNQTTLHAPVVFGSTALLNADPTTNLQAATKQYVDNKFPAVSGTINLAKLTVGGTNGSITVAGGLITAFINPT